MRRVLTSFLAALGAVAAIMACGAFDESGDEASGDAGTQDGASSMLETDAGEAPEAGEPFDSAPPELDGAPCDSTMPFIGAQSLGVTVNSAQVDHHPRLTADELTIYFGRSSPGEYSRLLRATRASRTEAFGAGEVLWPTGDPMRWSAWPSPKEERVYYDQNPNTFWRVLTAVDGKMTGILAPGLVQGPTSSLEAYFAPDESEVWWSSNRASGDVAVFDIFHATLIDGGYANPTVVSVSGGANERSAVVSADGLTLYFATDSGRKEGSAIFMATRANRETLSFTAPAPVPGLERLQDETRGFAAAPGWISPDNCRLYLQTNYDKTVDLYMAWRR